jgi:HEAT repeat protein
MKSRFLIVAGVVAFLTGLWFFLSQSRILLPPPNTDSVHASKQPSQGNKTSVSPRIGSDTAKTVSEKMKERDFNTLKVDLPEPEDKPWPGPFWNSSNFNSAENKVAALEVLPIWIRKAVLDGHKDQAGKHLFSLLTYLNDSDNNIRNKAALLLYKLGSRDTRLLDVLKEGIESNDSRKTATSLSNGRDNISQRSAILELLRFYDDHTFDDHIEAVFDKLPEKGAYTQDGRYNSKVMDLAKYLEAIGRPRTDAFWLARMEAPSDLSEAVKVLRVRNSVDLVAMLKSRIDTDPNSFASLTAAALVYGMTGETAYEPLLTKVVNEAVQSENPSTEVEIALLGLLSGKSSQAATIIKKALAAENVVLHDKALTALGQVSDESSIQMIKDYAKPIIDKDLFPNAAFKALIDMDNQEGDEAYEMLKSSVLSRNGRSEADFEALDFAKSHRAKFIR